MMANAGTTACRLAVAGLLASTMCSARAAPESDPLSRVAAARVQIVGVATPFDRHVASPEFSEVRLTLSPDGSTALWFSRDRPGSAGDYDIWISRRRGDAWSEPRAVPFNSPARDFDPAFTADGRHVYFCSSRAGGHGGDDVYRVSFEHAAFGAVEHLDESVNSAGNEFAPMLAPDGAVLLFSSDRAGGRGRQDLYTARRVGDGFDVAQAVPGALNTAADEFDATFLADGRAIVFSRAPDFRSDRVDLFVAVPGADGYGAGRRLPLSVNSTDTDTYGPMLDWSRPDRFTISAKRDGATTMDLYLVEYRGTATER
jgi:TolB protein